MHFPFNKRTLLNPELHDVVKKTCEFPANSAQYESTVHYESTIQYESTVQSKVKKSTVRSDIICAK